MELAKKEEQRIEKKQKQEGTGKEKISKRSIFMDVYAIAARMHMDKYGTTQRQLAAISSKNHFHSSMNPLAQHQKKWSIDEVLNDVEVAYPLTRAMCAPVGDGAAALVVCSDDFARRQGAKYSVDVAATVLASGETREEGQEDPVMGLAKQAYEKASIGPEDIDVAEVHDATAFGELSRVGLSFFIPVGRCNVPLLIIKYVKSRKGGLELKIRQATD